MAFGVAVSSDHIYTVEDDTGIRRTHRTDHTTEHIYSSLLVGIDPVLWSSVQPFAPPTSQDFSKSTTACFGSAGISSPVR